MILKVGLFLQTKSRGIRQPLGEYCGLYFLLQAKKAVGRNHMNQKYSFCTLSPGDFPFCPKGLKSLPGYIPNTHMVVFHLTKYICYL